MEITLDHIKKLIERSKEDGEYNSIQYFGNTTFYNGKIENYRYSVNTNSHDSYLTIEDNKNHATFNLKHLHKPLSDWLILIKQENELKMLDNLLSKL